MANAVSLTDPSITEVTPTAGDLFFLVRGGVAYRARVDTMIGGDGSGGATVLTDLGDVTITTPASAQILHYDGAAWRNVGLVAAIDAAIGSAAWQSGAMTGAQIVTAIDTQLGASGWQDRRRTGAEIVALIDAEVGDDDWQSGGAVASVAGLTGAVTAPDLRGALGVEAGATADQTGAELRAALTAELGSARWEFGTPTGVATAAGSTVLSAARAGWTIEVTDPGGATILVQPQSMQAFDAGDVVTIWRAPGAGAVTIEADPANPGATITLPAGRTATIGGEGEHVFLRRRGTADAWALDGGLGFA